MAISARSGNIELPSGVSREFLLHHRLCPSSWGDDGRLNVVTAPQVDPWALDELSIAYRCEILATPVTDAELDQLVERMTTGAERFVEVGVIGDSDDFAADLRDLVNQPPIIRYVNMLIREAHDAGASDIHLEATRDGFVSRFRVDGVLVPAPPAPDEYRQGVVSRVKLLAELDIAEKRRPQDGRIRVRLESRELDLRVSTVPTLHGESLVLRLLDRGHGPIDLTGLGMPASILASIQAFSTRPHGMLLVTGPTGCGKTTTMYACLQRRDGEAEKIITVEEPVEYHLRGVTQVPVNRAAGVNFAAALRSILRQDPDIIMIGEMRDAETALLAVQAAMTGHLVYSTLHTNDAVGAIPRLLDLGIPPYLVATTIEGVLAQRLVRRICEQCRVAQDACELADARIAGDSSIPAAHFKGAGCPSCRGTGFRGRVGIFEFLPWTAEVGAAIGANASLTDIFFAAKQAGLRSMREDGWDKVRAGLTTIGEVLRVVEA